MQKSALPSVDTRIQDDRQVSAGRPCLYESEVARKILERLASGESLRSICRDERMPPPSTVRGWVLDDRDGFATAYERARMLGCYAIADEMIEIASDDAGDVRTDKEGRIVVNNANVQRARLQIETKRWLLSKFMPAQFGDKVELHGPGGSALPAPTFNVTFVAAAVANDKS
jgi:hypothetical protein